MLGLNNTLANSGRMSIQPFYLTSEYSIEFDGTDDYINLSSPTALDDIYDGGGTFSAWVYPTATTSYNTIYDKAYHGERYNTLYLQEHYLGNYRLSFYREWSTADNAHWRNSSYIIPINAWSHIVLTYDDSTYSNSPVIYVNGDSTLLNAYNTPESGETAVSDAIYDLRIGFSNNETQPFEGNIDEVAIWDVILDADAVASLYNNGKPINLKFNTGNYDNSRDLVGWWRMGDGDTYSTITDNKGSADGTMTNMTSGDIVTEVPKQIAGLPSIANTYSLAFEGTDEYVALGKPLAYTTNPFTISSWVKLTDTDGVVSIFGMQSDAFAIQVNTQWNYIRCATSSESMQVNNAGSSPSNAVKTMVEGGAWHHLVVVRGDSTANNRIYLDGVSQTLSTNTIDTTSIPHNFQYIGVGDDSRNDPLTGSIDEFAIWNVALDADAVLTIYNSGAPIALDIDTGNYDYSSNLKNWYRMGDGDTFPTITNHKGALDGTMTNMASGDITADTP